MLAYSFPVQKTLGQLRTSHSAALSGIMLHLAAGCCSLICVLMDRQQRKRMAEFLSKEAPYEFHINFQYLDQNETVNSRQLKLSLLLLC